MKRIYFRHGDVHIVSVDSIPKDGIEENTDILMRGEVTGHAHRLRFRHGEADGLGVAKIIRGLNGVRYLHVTEPIDLTHEEHETRTIPPGDYEIRPTRETDHMAGVTRQLAD